eukprot:TRINITY_DN1137_c0_g3_i1.p1 TRINITY_DN1137_c0_g3~~TRINITY_DN1137_c0_g3_i1.p1  ORF type:complete len:404 (+),score=174.22 TRINITY_DN1137_c0_g3_i1:86-1213(+)
MQRAVLCVVVAALCASAVATKWSQLDDTYTFARYAEEFGKQYTATEHALRKTIFERRLAAIRLHNSNPAFTWKQGVNQFTDLTDEEYSRFLGFDARAHFASLAKPRHPRSAPAGVKAASALPASIDWRTKGVITPVKNQAACGSCWTFGTAETIESFHALAAGGNLTVLSEQQILDCTPNPNQCGGTGGCGGGTAEIAMDRIVAMGGLTSEAFYPYRSGNGQNFNCKFTNNVTVAPIAKLSGYVALPSNQYLPVLTALATQGPLIVNVDASAWSAYEEGVFNGCNQQNPDIDHVVQLVGYGTDSKYGDYWLVRNSWTTGWGESGYIRLSRSAADNASCGIDTNPQDGTGCNGGPSQVKVCGTCAILYDVLYPIIA